MPLLSLLIQRSHFFRFFVNYCTWQERKNEMYVLVLLLACINEQYFVNFNRKTLSRASWRCVLFTVISSIFQAVKKQWWLQPWSLVSLHHVIEPQKKKAHVIQLAPALLILFSSLHLRGQKSGENCCYQSFMSRNRSPKMPSYLINTERITATLAAENQCDHGI